MKKKVCVVTGTRAEYGLLKPLIVRISESLYLELQLIATGMHLSPEFGLTYKYIEEDGFKIDEKVEILMSSDTPVGISKSMGLTLISFSEVYQRLNPDILVILGDRYETFSAMAAAVVSRVPIAHIHGGEITEGAFDDSFRHSMTKMSYLHFTSTKEYRKRVIQLGEEPERVFNVGALGIDNVLDLPCISKNSLEKKIGIRLDGDFALIVFHPVTLENNTAEEQINQILAALKEKRDMIKVFIKGNSDTTGRVINASIEKFVEDNEKAYSFSSLPIETYLHLLKESKVIIGNSSSGIIEAPAFRVPTINIGDRQKGRIKASSVIDCKPFKENILRALRTIESGKFEKNLKEVMNPYGIGNTSEMIVNIIKDYLLDKEINLKKKFNDIVFEV
ncbi:MAG: UDP-N-acetylglucosamine 2-epimerase [Halanaerobiales bacterium]